MKDKEHGQLARLTQTRDTLVKLRTALKNKINNILSARGLNLPKEALSSEKRLKEVLSLEILCFSPDRVRTLMSLAVNRSPSFKAPAL